MLRQISCVALRASEERRGEERRVSYNQPVVAGEREERRKEAGERASERGAVGDVMIHSI